MLLLRLAAILAVIAVATLIAAYLLTRDRKYLRYALRVFTVVLGIAFLFLCLLALERLLVLA